MMVLPPKWMQKATFWFCLILTTTRRRKDSVDVLDVPLLNPGTKTTEAGRDGRF